MHLRRDKQGEPEWVGGKRTYEEEEEHAKCREAPQRILWQIPGLSQRHVTPSWQNQVAEDTHAEDGSECVDEDGGKETGGEKEDPRLGSLVRG